ncbi:MAG: glycosyltransferase [Verrucomicrobiota bacterium]|nr:glycosyltransferase [Verrucomicrobiota bacterium]
MDQIETKQEQAGDKDSRSYYISVIIPAHNEEGFLRPTLDALKQQTFRDFEVIVVANGCSDRTVAEAEGHCDQLFDLQERGLGKARNLGGFKARGELLVFLDADTILEPTALEIIANQFTKRCAMGTLKGSPDTKRGAYRLIYFFKNFVHASHLHWGSSGVILCWKRQFERVGGFDEMLYLRENSDLMKKLARFGRYKYIRRTPAITSMRRYDERGPAEMVWFWMKVWWMSNFSDIRNQTYEKMHAKTALPTRRFREQFVRSRKFKMSKPISWS